MGEKRHIGLDLRREREARARYDASIREAGHNMRFSQACFQWACMGVRSRITSAVIYRTKTLPLLVVYQNMQ